MKSLWAALLPHYPTSSASPAEAAHMDGLALWALQFTPRVVCVPAAQLTNGEPHFGDALVMELSTSERLFGGQVKLAQRIRRESRQLGVTTIAWAPTSLGAVALARCGLRHGFGNQPWDAQLDTLPLHAIDAVARHAAILAQLGCNNLGAVRALPRSGVVRRFDTQLLAALDTTYGLRADGYAWITPPEHFDARLELALRVEHADALLHGAQRLLLQLCGWLVAKRAGIRSFTLRWCHDAMRSKHAGDGGELTLHTGSATRDIQHLSRLLQAHLAHVQLLAPVGELSLHAHQPEPLQETSASLLLDKAAEDESLAQVLERISARLGTHLVQRPVLCADHRPEWQVQWQPTSQALPATTAAPPPLPQPSLLLAEPLRLLQNGNSQPLYQGQLQLLAGPQRLEGGWWHRSPSFLASNNEEKDKQTTQIAHTAVRDYWVANSPHAGLLWVFHTRLSPDNSAWFLHGIFA